MEAVDVCMDVEALICRRCSVFLRLLSWKLPVLAKGPRLFTDLRRMLKAVSLVRGRWKRIGLDFSEFTFGLEFSPTIFQSRFASLKAGLLSTHVS